MQRRASGGTAGMNAHKRLAGGPNGIDRPFFHVVDSHELSGSHREDNRIDIVRDKASVIQRSFGRILRQLNIGLVGDIASERGFSHADNSNLVFVWHSSDSLENCNCVALLCKSVTAMR